MNRRSPSPLPTLPAGRPGPGAMRLVRHDVHSPLGRWSHAEWRPPSLAGCVERLWHFEGHTTMPRERTFPGGYLELILHLGPRFHDVSPAGRRGDRFPLACLTGLQVGPQVIEAPPEPCCVLGIRLHPVGACLVLGRPLHEVTGLTVDLADLLGAAAGELAERCRVAQNVEDRFCLVTHWIAGRMAASPGVDTAITWAATALQSTDGRAPIGALREQTGLGAARFATRFREHVGTTPKHYARVLRFRNALTLLQRGCGLADVALRAGYYDQPHMNADFRELACLTPAAFVAAARYPNSPSVAEPT